MLVVWCCRGEVLKRADEASCLKFGVVKLAPGSPAYHVHSWNLDNDVDFQFAASISLPLALAL